MATYQCECCKGAAHDESAEVFDMGRGVDGLLACVDCALAIRDEMIAAEDRDGEFFDAVFFWELPEAHALLARLSA